MVPLPGGLLSVVMFGHKEAVTCVRVFLDCENLRSPVPRHDQGVIMGQRCYRGVDRSSDTQHTHTHTHTHTHEEALKGRWEEAVKGAGRRHCASATERAVL